MNRIPRVSVLMPVYNAQNFLHDSISSILNQTFFDFDFIIINDGSTDDTLLIFEKIKSDNQSIRIKIIDKKNPPVKKKGELLYLKIITIVHRRLYLHTQPILGDLQI